MLRQSDRKRKPKLWVECLSKHDFLCVATELLEISKKKEKDACQNSKTGGLGETDMKYHAHNEEHS